MTAGVVESKATIAPAGSGFRVLLWSGLALVALFAVVSLIRAGGATSLDLSGPPLPIGPAVPEFALVERSGKPVTLADLRGRIWLADFIFTRCSGPCPELTARMYGLQLALADQPEVKLVTFTLDPKNDTPEVLGDYARRFHADPQRWWFLTGDDEETIHNLVEKGLKQTVIPAKDDRPIIHSEYIVIVDGEGRIRAAHSGMDPGAKPLILRDIAKLRAEATPGP